MHGWLKNRCLAAQINSTERLFYSSHTLKLHKVYWKGTLHHYWSLTYPSAMGPIHTAAIFLGFHYFTIISIKVSLPHHHLQKKVNSIKLSHLSLLVGNFFQPFREESSNPQKVSLRRAFPLIKLRMLFVNTLLNTDSLTEFLMDKWPLSTFFGLRTSLN